MSEHFSDEHNVLSLKLADAVINCLGSLVGVSGSMMSRRRAFAQCIADEIDADAWCLTKLRLASMADEFSIETFLSGGLDEAGVGLMIESTHDRSCPPPESEHVLTEIKQGLPTTHLRRDWFTADEYRSTSFFELYRQPLGIDESLHAVFPIDETSVSYVVFYRASGRPEFSSENRQFAHTVHSAAQSLHAVGPEVNDVIEMTPRMQTVCALLLQGCKRKQIAERLGITEHTARDYIRGVYRHFDVKDHVSLMHHFMIGDECPSSRAD